ncbi:hypothetical protein [Flavimaricola marinus]|uniref:Lipoprotein n=1 Tax=Flavimaricola marinus TaxID=1819565 RepID=A0A238L8S2_9RHOB|nr:hypothetical protein [Flavimaricola marinus]SMY06079.1 hypothetical protein LOM8899_00200 [Flavimaricola marinus]
MTLRLIKPVATLAAVTLIAACSSGSTVTYQAASNGCSGLSSGYVNSVEGLPMRCGPQEQSPWERPL